jgi:hypothetical protein
MHISGQRRRTGEPLSSFLGNRCSIRLSYGDSMTYDLFSFAGLQGPPGLKEDTMIRCALLVGLYPLPALLLQDPAWQAGFRRQHL